MPKPPEQPPPPRNLAISVVWDGLKVRIPIAAVVVLVLLLTTRAIAPEVGPVPLPVPQDQRWTASSGLPVAVASLAVRGALPAPDPRQRRPPCNEELGEEEIGGVCWIWLGRPPPCPQGQSWERNGKCYARVLEAKALPREPTSGEGRPLGVADP